MTEPTLDFKFTVYFHSGYEPERRWCAVVPNAIEHDHEIYGPTCKAVTRAAVALISERLAADATAKAAAVIEAREKCKLCDQLLADQPTPTVYPE